MPGKKNLGRLIPTKKNVVNKRTGQTSEITYYIDPNKDKPPVDKHRAKDQQNDDRLTKPKQEHLLNPAKKENDVDATDPKVTKDLGHPFDNVKSFEDFGKKGIDPVAARQFFCNM